MILLQKPDMLEKKKTRAESVLKINLEQFIFIYDHWKKMSKVGTMRF